MCYLEEETLIRLAPQCNVEFFVLEIKVLCESFFHISFHHLTIMFGVRCRYGKVIYVRDKPHMMMLFWNITTFDQLKRELVCWLDGKIPEGKKIRSIERLDNIFGWVRMKTDKDAREMMFGRDDISLIVVIS